MASRQEVLNVLLAQILQEHGIVAAPEQILKISKFERDMPDVLVEYQGLRLIIEAETDGPGKEFAAYTKARERVETAVAHIAIAVVYPAELKGNDFSTLKKQLSRSRVKFLLVTETILEPEQIEFYQESGQTYPSFTTGNIDDLINMLRRSYSQLVNDETLNRAVAKIETDIEFYTRMLLSKKGSIERLANTLNSPLNNNNSKKYAKQKVALLKISALILINAMIFHEILADTDGRVKPLKKINLTSGFRNAIHTEWKNILDNINYYPIFYMAQSILEDFTADSDFDKSLKKLTETAQEIVLLRASLRHDLAGRIYHTLLEEAKYLGAYYTSIPAASLLLKLTLNDKDFNCNWESADSIKHLKIADLACGTGTLLMAASDAITDNYIIASAYKGKIPQLLDFQKLLVENVIYGYDVLQSAIHLTASTLTLRTPELPVNATHLHSLPLGGPSNLLGSLEFLRKTRVAGTLFSAPKQVTAYGEKEEEIEIPDLDLCVMNPPFTRSVGGNLLFGNLPEKQRGTLQKELSQIVRKQDISANISAGLGSVFVALGDIHIKDGGYISLVLPRALLAGYSWKKTRDILAEKYNLKYIVVCHEPNHWNFSENTDLSEVLIIAQKCRKENVNNNAEVTCVNLWRNPRTAIEALNIVAAFKDKEVPNIQSDHCKLNIETGHEKYGEVTKVNWEDIKHESWNIPCAFAQTELTKTLYDLRNGIISTHGKKKQRSIPLCQMKDLGDFSYDCHAVHDGFKLSKSKTNYPTFWNHMTPEVGTLIQSPNNWLEPKLRDNAELVQRLWDKSSRLLVAESLRLNTMKAWTIHLSNPVISNVWWSFKLSDHFNKENLIAQYEKSLAIWLSSTLGLIMLMGERIETEGPWVQLKKKNLEKMKVLNIASLDEEVILDMAKAFDTVSKLQLQPLKNIAHDEVRESIDRYVSEILDLPDLSNLRELISKEPIITLDLNSLLI